MPKRKPISSNTEEIKTLMEQTKEAKIYRKLQCIYLGDKHPEMTAADIGKITQFSENRVKIIHCEFREKGIESLKDNRGSRGRAHFTLEEEAEILCEFEEISKAGELCEVSRIKLAYEKKLGKKVHRSVIYRMMKRHDYRKIVPYQRHKKGNKEEQESFKKTSKIR